MPPSTPVTLRLTLVHPPPGVRWAVQLGRDALLPPVRVAPDELVFEVPLTLGPNARGTVQLRGPAIQGPPAARFICVNSGKRAAEFFSRWDRRAKVSVATIDLDALQAVNGPVVLDGAIQGTARDGGPACASVALIDGAWQLHKTARYQQGQQPSRRRARIASHGETANAASRCNPNDITSKRPCPRALLPGSTSP
jgi:hypothetical protein